MAIMFTQRIILCLALLILTAETLAQCSDPNSQPCSASQSNDVVEADLAATEVNDGLAALFAAAGVGIHRFFRRQDTVDGSPKLCCSQNTECLSIAGVPYCYDTVTTGFTFANGSYGFLSNETFYSADGSNLNDSNGDDTRADGLRDTSASAASAPTNSAKATPTGVANASHGPSTSGTLTGKGAKSDGQSTPSTSGSIESTSSTGSVAVPTATSNSAYQVGGQNGAAATGFVVAWIVWIFSL